MRRSACFISCAVLAFTLPGKFIASAENRAGSEKKVIVSRSFVGQPLPKWQNGFLLARDFPEPTVYVYDRSGAEVSRTAFSFSGSVRTLITDVSISSTGRIAVCGTVDSADGASTAFIAWVQPSGRIERVVRTSPFAAFKISFTNDGVLWALGREHLPDYNEKPEYDLLRSFDADGNEIKSTLPRSSFAAPRPHPASGNSFLVTSSDRIGIYSEPATEWIELSTAGVMMGRWSGIKADRVAGVAIADSGTVYVSGLHKGRPGDQLTIYKRDRSSISWTAISASLSHEHSSTAVYGVDNDHLILAGRLPEFLWVKAP